MNSISGTDQDENSNDAPPSIDADVDESFITATDEWQQEQAGEETIGDLAAEVARAEAYEQRSESSYANSDAARKDGPGQKLKQQGEEDDRESISVHDDASEGSVRAASISSDEYGSFIRARPRSIAKDNGSGGTASRSPSLDLGPSLRDFLHSTPGSSRPGSSLSLRSRQSPQAHAFEKRFHARKSLGLDSLTDARPGAVNLHMRQVSQSSQITVTSSEPEQEEDKPWEVVKWTKLKKLSSQAFSEAGRRAFGNCSYLVIGASIVIGTTKGLIMVFDYQQNLKSIVGQGTPAAECGSILALALSADHSAIAAGHSNGFIFTWDMASPAKPFLIIPSIPRDRLASRPIDGHIADHPIIHIGFLGTRHTALVSADRSGMAFSHLATRGLGAVGRTVKTTRILGRYPTLAATSNVAQKATTVLACAPLPLGNVEQATDEMGLTALLTPYLLVIVSTTPIAQTHYKTPRSNMVDAHSPLTGCLAWFPAVRLKNVPAEGGKDVSGTKLAFAWSDVLQILEVEVERSPTDEDPKRPHIAFRRQCQWTSEEAIVGIQWIARSVLAILTITQRLVILDESTLEVSDSADLNPRHIYHRDVFSQQLQPFINKTEELDEAIAGGVPDAYSMSFKAYRGRLFLLDVADVSMGTLSNWADRLVALMETGRLTQAIDLATSYYSGTTNRTTVGLPEDDHKRKATVYTRIVQIIKASLDYTFRLDEKDELEKDLRTALQDLIEPIFAACLCIDDIEFLLHDIYENYSIASCQDLFLYALEPRILEGAIRYVPADMVKDLVNWFSSHNLGVRLEAMICALDTESLDLDQITTLCKANHLYDALIYVWNQAIGDFVTPLDDLLELTISPSPGQTQNEDRSKYDDSASKVFPYLAYSFTGRVYPSGEEMSPSDAEQAKAQLYECLFADNNQTTPAYFKETRSSSDYFRLRTILTYNSFNFMSMLNEAFEDSYLNEQGRASSSNVRVSNGNYSFSGRGMSREQIIRILRQLLSTSSFEREDRVYLDIFIARNMPKFPQYIKVPGVVLHQILEELCEPPREDLVEECQLSVEYLMSIYRPPDVQSMIPLFEQAGFFRVLKYIHKASKQYSAWLQAHFDDPRERDSVFDCIEDCFKLGTALGPRQSSEIDNVVIEHSEHLASQDPERCVSILSQHRPDMLQKMFDQPSMNNTTQFNFLKALFSYQHENDMIPVGVSRFMADHIEEYVRLMCRFSPADVSAFVHTTKTGDLRLDEILPVMESTGVIDAAVLLLAKDGLIDEAMTRLISHLKTLQTALVGLLASLRDDKDGNASQRSLDVDEVLETIQQYARMGIWLCQGANETSNIRSSQTDKLQISDMTEADLTTSEVRWLELINVVTSVSRAATSLQRTSFTKHHSEPNIADPIRSFEDQSRRADDELRKVVQDCFTALLGASATVIPTTVLADLSSPQAAMTLTHSTNLDSTPSTAQPPRLLPVLNAFLTRLSEDVRTHQAEIATPSKALLPILTSIFSAHTFEHSLLNLATALLDRDVFVSVAEADAQRRRGWRPQGRACAACGLRAWGVGAGVNVWQDWAEGKAKQDRTVKTFRGGVYSHRDGQELTASISQGREKKGKSRLVEPMNASAGDGRPASEVDDTKQARGLVVFACGHLFHRGCLEAALKSQGRSAEVAQDTGAADEKRRPTFVCLLCH